MENSKVAIIAPYKSLSLLAAQACNDLGEKVVIKTGDLAAGVQIAKDCLKEGAEIFISRGGTARAIKASVDAPVVEIKISGFDLIRAIGLARDKGRNIGVVGFKNVIYGSKSLSKVLNVRISEFEIEDSSEAENMVLRAINKGINVLVGDAVATRLAGKYGLESILITSGKESVNAAIRESYEILELQRREQARTEQLKTILEFAYEGIVAVDQQGRITQMNPEAEKMLQLNKDDVIGKIVPKALSEIPFYEVLNFGKIRSGELMVINGKSLALNVVPVVINNHAIGAVATIQNIKHIQEVEEKARKKQYEKGLVANYKLSDIVTTVKVMQDTLERARKFAGVDSTILIYGETGTGKEMFAQGIHNCSKRKEGPFVAINCAALTESILESELFGYEGGAFTGAKKEGRKGLFELAHGGTIFLDEIVEISTSMQARLLRVLQEREIMRIGGNKVIPIDVRVIAATSKDLQKLIEEDKFRRDLYHRLSVLFISIPPLRERIDDISVLLRVLSRDLSKQLKIESPDFDDKAMELLKSYSWPGNVRELKNLLEQLIVLNQGSTIKESAIFNVLSNTMKNIYKGKKLSKKEVALFSFSLAEIEKSVIMSVLESSSSKKEAAEKLGISTTTLWRKIKSFQNESNIT